MSTDDLREPDDVDGVEAAAAASADASGAVSGSGEASDDAAADIHDIESVPLAERAPRYQELADRLRSELERSDPSRDPN
ncbi:hypothetical protein J2X63_002634 [Agromyces sp. 3263]|uniref:hypothetical protein n=1 Tax=Agromyces sp. 3263 TaxID=2817750 RepID=UPI0028629DE6|nr:hypothetical protein [Agromyces sp. 3263]MDR6906926.1 hypothetical protein [Agromyces sp. 3263]